MTSSIPGLATCTSQPACKTSLEGPYPSIPIQHETGDQSAFRPPDVAETLGIFHVPSTDVKLSPSRDNTTAPDHIALDMDIDPPRKTRSNRSSEYYIHTISHTISHTIAHTISHTLLRSRAEIS